LRFSTFMTAKADTIRWIYPTKPVGAMMQDTPETIEAVFEELELTAYAARSQFSWQDNKPTANFDVVVSDRSNPFAA
jgi:hypothetical protein